MSGIHFWMNSLTKNLDLSDMRRTSIHFIFTLLFGVLVANAEYAAYDTSRIVTIGGPVTDIVFKLGIGDNIVAVDQSSTRPEKVKELPQVGYIRTISSEGVLSMNPSLIVTTTDLGPPIAVDQLKAGGVPVLQVKDPRSAEEVINMVTTIGKALGKNEEAEKIARHLNEKFQQAKSRRQGKDIPTVVFFMNSRSQGAISAAGKDTRADTIIRMAGGQNAFVEHRGYKAVSPEVLLKIDPDFIFIASINGNDTQQLDAFIKDPALKPLNALREGRVYAADITTYLSFGTHIGDSVNDLSIKFYSED